MSATTLHPYAVPRPFGRRFATILGLSIALHGSLFLFTAWQRQRPPLDLPPIMASIRLLPPDESGSPAAVVPAPATIPQKVRQTTSRREKRSSPDAQVFAGPANAPVEAAAGSAPVAAVASVAEGAPAALASSPPPAAIDLLAAYRQQLTRLLAGQREYPRIAAMRGWEGEVRLRLRVARKGNLLGVVLYRSSGFEVLDQHAMDMLAGLSGLPPLPEGLDGSEIQVVVPIHYKLNKTT